MPVVIPTLAIELAESVLSPSHPRPPAALCLARLLLLFLFVLFVLLLSSTLSRFRVLSDLCLLSAVLLTDTRTSHHSATRIGNKAMWGTCHF